MSDEVISSLDMNYNIYGGISSVEASNIPILEANFSDDDQEVTQPIGNNNIEDQEAAVNQPAAVEKQEKVIPAEAKKYIGVIICKECNGIKYLGTVVDYDVDRKWFRIEYEDEGSEDMAEELVLKFLAKEDQLFSKAPAGSRMKKLSGRSSKKSGGGKKKKKGGSGEQGPNPRSKKRNTCEGPYIPLAYRETRKDAYYWY